MPVSRSSKCLPTTTMPGLAIAKETSYKNFAEKVEGGQQLIDKALAVE